MNTVLLTGRAVKAPELKTSSTSGKEYCQLTIAVDRGRDRDGNDMGADFPQIMCFGRTAQTVSQYVGKGRPLLVTARIRTGSYEREGRKIYETSLFADKIEFLGPNPEKKENPAEEKPAAEPGQSEELKEIPSGENVPAGFESVSDEDVPF